MLPVERACICAAPHCTTLHRHARRKHCRRKPPPLRHAINCDVGTPSRHRAQSCASRRDSTAHSSTHVVGCSKQQPARVRVGCVRQHARTQAPDPDPDCVPPATHPASARNLSTSGGPRDPEWGWGARAGGGGGRGRESGKADGRVEVRGNGRGACVGGVGGWVGVGRGGGGGERLNRTAMQQDACCLYPQTQWQDQHAAVSSRGPRVGWGGRGWWGHVLGHTAGAGGKWRKQARTRAGRGGCPAAAATAASSCLPQIASPHPAALETSLHWHHHHQ